LEDLGFCKKGDAGRFIEDGNTHLNAEISVNASGGLKAKGHPIGASGIAQAVEAVTQLRQEAKHRQVDDIKHVMTHNVGGTGGTAVVHIFGRD
jgi:acetyl-CoA C-acetyltransferase